MLKHHEVSRLAKNFDLTICSLPRNSDAVVDYAAQDAGPTEYAKLFHYSNLTCLPEQRFGWTHFCAEVAVNAPTCSSVDGYGSFSKKFLNVQWRKKLYSSFLFLLFQCPR
jgi:hypothetical protein